METDKQAVAELPGKKRPALGRITVYHWLIALVFVPSTLGALWRVWGDVSAEMECSSRSTAVEGQVVGVQTNTCTEARRSGSRTTTHTYECHVPEIRYDFQGKVYSRPFTDGTSRTLAAASWQPRDSSVSLAWEGSSRLPPPQRRSAEPGHPQRPQPT